MIRLFRRSTKMPRGERSRHGRAGERGQSLVEMAGSLTFLLLLVSVVIDVGWAFYTLTTLRDTVQEAASYAAICPFKNDNLTANSDLILERFKLSASAPIDMSQINNGDIKIAFSDSAGNDLKIVSGKFELPKKVMGGSVSIQVVYQHQILVPFLGAIIGDDSYPLTVSVTNTVMRSKYFKQCDD